MGTFRFRLARLARARATQEHVARGEWAGAVQAADAAETAADAARAELARARARLAELLAAGLGPRDVLTHQAALDRLQSWRRTLAERARATRARADELRAVLEERRRDRKGLERLEDRDRAAWHRAESLKEAARMDEIASVRDARSPGRPAPAPRPTEPGPDGPGPTEPRPT